MTNLVPIGVPKRKVSGYAREEDNWYTEPLWTVELLSRHEKFPGIVWDPACGHGQIAKGLRQPGTEVISTDLYPRPACPEGGLDFLKTPGAVLADHIVTNPPYGRDIGMEFALKAIEAVSGKVAFLVRLDFLAGQKRYRDLYSKYPPARIYVLSRRPSMPPGRIFTGNERGGQHDYCWIVWDWATMGQPTETHWLSPDVVTPSRRTKGLAESAHIDVE